jgi:NTE family protein
MRSTVQTTQLGDSRGVATRLARMERHLQQRLVNWGYAVCDTAMRKHVVPGTPPPAGFPYASAGL